MSDPNEVREREIREHFEQALRQWRMYANEHRQFDGDWIEESSDPEARLYRRAKAALSRLLELEEELATTKDTLAMRTGQLHASREILEETDRKIAEKEAKGREGRPL